MAISLLLGFALTAKPLGAASEAAAKLSNQGGAFAGAMSISPGVWLYQLTDDGLALELTVKGTKYYKAGVLN